MDHSEGLLFLSLRKQKSSELITVEVPKVSFPAVPLTGRRKLTWGELNLRGGHIFERAPMSLSIQCGNPQLTSGEPHIINKQLRVRGRGYCGANWASPIV